MTDKNVTLGFVDNALKNVTDEPSKGVGKTLADLWFLVFGSVSQKADMKRMQYAHDLSLFEKELTDSIDAIPEDKRIDPNIQTTAQALEASKYCITSETLRKMFVNLISGSVNKDLEPHVHPSFPEILKQLGEKDARLLQVFKQSPILPVVDIGYTVNPKGYQLLSRYVLLPINQLSSEDCTLSAAALSRSGLISISTGNEHLTNDNKYEPFKELDVYKEAVSISQSLGAEPHMSKGICRLTNLGEAFISVCVQ